MEVTYQDLSVSGHREKLGKREDKRDKGIIKEAIMFISVCLLNVCHT